MTLFAEIPNKAPRADQKSTIDVWPSLSEECEMNLFFREFTSAEGWLGDGYLAIWPCDEIHSFEEVIQETYPEKYHFFASDGGGTQFGFFSDNSKMTYISAPDIGSVDDIRVLGNWDEFLRCVRENDYI